MSAKNGGLLLSVIEAGEMLDIPAKTLRRWISEGRLPAVKAGRLVRIRRRDVEVFAERGLAALAPAKPDRRRSRAGVAMSGPQMAGGWLRP